MDELYPPALMTELNAASALSRRICTLVTALAVPPDGDEYAALSRARAARVGEAVRRGLENPAEIESRFREAVAEIAAMEKLLDIAIEDAARYCAAEADRFAAQAEFDTRRTGVSRRFAELAGLLRWLRAT